MPSADKKMKLHFGKKFQNGYHFFGVGGLSKKGAMTNEVSRAEYETLIFTIRGKKVMVDYDLALIYDVPTKALKQQVRRNMPRFPEDFIFELTEIEQNELVTNCDRLVFLKHSSIKSMVFTEQGVSMLSSVLRSEKAILMNIEIMRAFARYRALIRETSDLKKDITELDNKFTKAFNYLLNRLDELHQKKALPRKRIGYLQDDI